MPHGYYRYPTIHGTTVVFTSEDDLWEVDSAHQQPARRLTCQAGVASHAAFSPSGRFVAFSGSHEGHQEVYVLDRTTGAVSRRTYLGDMCMVVGWQDEDTILFASSAHQAFGRYYALYTVGREVGDPTMMQAFHSCQFISYGPKGACVIQRHGYREYAYWKRYRGGTAGQIWIDAKGTGDFKKLALDNVDCANPMWVESRIYFIADHEGVGNLYSCTPEGQDIRRETHHDDFYVRHAKTDGHSIVYHVGGALYRFDVKTRKTMPLSIEFIGTRASKGHKFTDGDDYLEDVDLHPKGHHLTMTSRGQAFVMGTFDGPTLHLPSTDGRLRLSRWLSDGKRVVLVNDAPGEEHLEIYDAETLRCLSKSPVETAHNKPLPKSGPLGRVVDMVVSPVKDQVALTNHRGEIILVDLKTWKQTLVDRSAYGPVGGLAWSPDGAWLAYGSSIGLRQSVIKLVQIKTGKVHTVTEAVLRDSDPAFSPDGKYLYFISYRHFEPAWDTLHFEMGFPFGSKPYALLLQKDADHPFIERPEALAEVKKPKGKGKTKDAKEEKDDKDDAPVKVVIDFEGLGNRIVPLPVPAGVYSQVLGVRGKVLMSVWPACPAGRDGNDSGPKGATVLAYDFETHRTEPLYTDVMSMQLSLDYNHLLYIDHETAIRVVKAGEKPEDSDEAPPKKTGWVDLTRLRVPVNVLNEWRQIFNETWRLQRDHFWVEDMSKLDWVNVYNRYVLLLDRIGSRAELNDLLWDLQGELGTSHAYVFGGDLPKPPRYSVGKLGADMVYDKKTKGYRVDKLYRGDPWNHRQTSPLQAPGAYVAEGDVITHINGKAVGDGYSPQAALLNKAGQEVSVTVNRKASQGAATIIVRTLASEQPLRYREWVNRNRQYVHDKSKGKVGYIHVPDMGPLGYAEFHRGFLAECEYDALIVDVRFNGGGNVSSLLLEKLNRRRLGYDLSRWVGAQPYPMDSPQGAMVALTNEYAGSDGDIFSHSFKMMKLGPLIGKRTWGGVIGISSNHDLVDRGETTQPEYSFWFTDVGWTVENYGVDPDIEVEITPADYAAGRDPQLDRGIKEALNELKKKPPLVLDTSTRPDLRQWLGKKKG